MAPMKTALMISVNTRVSEQLNSLMIRLVVLACLGIVSFGCSSKSDSAGADDQEHLDHDGHEEDDEDDEEEHGSEHVGSDTAYGDDDDDMDMDMEDTPPPKEEALPDKLSETGLYTDILNKTVAPAQIHYTPQFQLWSDGADKDRWAYIPDGKVVNTTDMNNWSVPVGSRFFKEFSVDGRRIETRLIERVGSGPRDFAFVSYLWNEDETEATKVSPEGLQNASGTNHDVPSKLGCLRCHGTHPLGGGRASRMLGFSAIQLSHDDTDTSIGDITDKLSHPPEESFTVPGDSTAQAALGYLHANCGNCHNDGPDRIPQVNLSFWLNVEDTTVEETEAWETAVSQANAIFNDQHVIGRIAPGNPEESAVIYRMSQRGNTAQMPPLATETTDETGVSAVTDWIRSLP
jgi:hypothetical protein